MNSNKCKSEKCDNEAEYCEGCKQGGIIGKAINIGLWIIFIIFLAIAVHQKMYIDKVEVCLNQPAQKAIIEGKEFYILPTDKVTAIPQGIQLNTSKLTMPIGG